MTGYIVRRILASIPVILVIAIMTFSITFIAPGDAAYAIAGEEATDEDIEYITELMGLDRPFLVQFGSWFGRVFKGDRSNSSIRDLSVNDVHTAADQSSVLLESRTDRTLGCMMVLMSARCWS